MTVTQIILLGIVALFIFFRIKKSFSAKGIANYSAAEVNGKKKDVNVVLLDVRTDAERKGRHIKGSLHIPLHEIGSRVGELEKYKAKEIICYCQSGSRSISAAIKLKQLGFNAANMLGGMSGWSY